MDIVLCRTIIYFLLEVDELNVSGFSSETQLVCNLLAVDGVNDADVVALNAASASIAMSDIPWDGPVGAVRVGKDPKSTNLIINPTRKELLNSQVE